MGDFTEQEIDTVYRVMAARRGMRHFRPDPLDETLIGGLLGAAHLAARVGLTQPWRFIRVRDRALRTRIHAVVEAERLETARALGEREDQFMRLKVEGILECGELLVVALMAGREAHAFGRRTLPEMDLASVACAIQNLWLAARAESIGMGWYRGSIRKRCGSSFGCLRGVAQSPYCALGMCRRSTHARCLSRSIGPVDSTSRRW